MDKETRTMFNTILAEMSRMETRIDKRFDGIDSVSLLIKRMDNLEDRIIYFP